MACTELAVVLCDRYFNALMFLNLIYYYIILVTTVPPPSSRFEPFSRCHFHTRCFIVEHSLFRKLLWYMFLKICSLHHSKSLGTGRPFVKKPDIFYDLINNCFFLKFFAFLIVNINIFEVHNIPKQNIVLHNKVPAAGVCGLSSPVGLQNVTLHYKKMCALGQSGRGVSGIHSVIAKLFAVE